MRLINGKENFCLFFLYGCETWSLTLREESRLSTLKRIFGPKRDEVTRERRKLHNEELKQEVNVIS